VELVGAAEGTRQKGAMREVSHSQGWWRDKGVPPHPTSLFIAPSQRERAASQ